MNSIRPVMPMFYNQGKSYVAYDASPHSIVNSSQICIRHEANDP